MLETNAQLVENTTKIVFPQIVERLTKPISKTESVKAINPRNIVFKGTIDAVNRHFSDEKWSDGLAIVPPTVERVEEFLKYTDHSPDE